MQTLANDEAPNHQTQPSFCIMCGWIFSKGKGIRRIGTPVLQARIRKQWREGPIVYCAVMANDEPVSTCCATCLKRPGDGTTMLPLDSYLLYLMAPTKNPDLRRQKRMQTALLRTCPTTGMYNPYATPRWVLDIASSKDPVRAWWERNLCTDFFQHKHTARCVRLMLRGAPGSTDASTAECVDGE